MGFFAEGLREYLGDKTKEKEYLSSMVKELKYDTAQYNVVLSKIYYVRPLLDSLFINVHEADRFNYVLLGKWNTPINETRVIYMPTMPTIQQLKSSGNMRLIQSEAVLEKTLRYETFVNGGMKSETEAITAATEKIFKFEDDFCDESEFNKQTDTNMQDKSAQYNMENGSIYDMGILVKDRLQLNQFANSFTNYKSRNWGYYTITNRAKQLATDLIKLIDEKYDFK
jgi:hypothetical protein